MSVTLEDLQPYVGKEAVVHLNQEDGSAKEVTGTIKAATVAGVPFKEKGKAGITLLQVSDFYEIADAPVKEKSVTQKKLQPIELGQARQHLLDRHGVELSWAKEATEQQAFDWHAGLDHTNLGHVHVAKEDKPKDEREQALSDGGGTEG